jgi:hypothetical protein
MSHPLTRRHVLRLGGATMVVAGVGSLPASVHARTVIEADLVVYGATAAGIVAAVQAHRMGRTAVVIDPGTHLGGLTTGGAGVTDTGTGAAIGGIAGEFYRRVHARYERTGLTATLPPRYRFEPHVASAVVDDLLEGTNVVVYFGQRLTRVDRRGTRITGVATDSGRLFRAPVYIDASYEGDLMDGAGVRWTLGREGNAVYGETLGGVRLGQRHQFTLPVSPYRVDGDPASGLLPGIARELAPPGSADPAIPAYSYRMCLTVSGERIPFTRPDGYDPDDYELLWRCVERGWTGPYFSARTVGGHKTDSASNGPISTDHIGFNGEYPTADYARRAAIAAEHRRYQQGLLWFLTQDPRLPSAVRSVTGAWGLAADEFTTTGGWSPQLQVREARRMVSDQVMTERHCRGRARVSDPVALAGHAIDANGCQRVAVDGRVRNEGDVTAAVPDPYPVSYRSIVPSAAECTNLLVPVCLSTSHVASGSLRTEPVTMVLAQSAATAAVMAAADGIAVQDVPYPALADRLQADGQILRWPVPGVEVIIDNGYAAGVRRRGRWRRHTHVPGYHGGDYEDDGNTAKGVTSMRFIPRLPADGRWTVQMRWTAGTDRASNVPVDIHHAGGVTTRRIDQRESGGAWVPLGSFRFSAGRQGSVLLRTDGTDGYVIADAVRFVYD